MKLLGCFSIGLIALSITHATAAEPNRPTEQTRPNILWIIIDDMSANLSCYGETLIKTPHVDQLAASGVRFTRAYVTAPVCSTNRSALITGMYQTTIGAHHHRSGRGERKIRLPDGVRPIPELFQAAGYYTAITAWPNGPQRRLGKTDYNFEWDPAIYDGSDWSNRKPGQPFFAQVQLPGGKHRGGKLKTFERMAKRADELFGNHTDPQKVKLPPYYPRDPVLLRDWAAYLDAVRLTDKFVGDVITRLKNDGDYENTVIFFITDHGISHARGKQFLYDEGLHVPLVVSGPGIPSGEVRSDLVEHIDIAAASLALAGIEIPETMQAKDIFAKDYAKRDAVFAARDRCDETIDRIRSVRTERFKYIRNFMPERPYLQPNRYKDDKDILIALRKAHVAGKLNAAQELIFRTVRPKEELYDLEKDPHELHNLAGDPRYRKSLLTLRKRLDDWIVETGDQGEESAEMYDSDMAVYIATVKKKFPERLPRLLHNIRLMKQWNKPRPNIVLIMADDMGYSDIGCYGGEISTPRLDALAARGLRFTQFYNTARCCPTRASLLTGLYPHQAGIGHMMNDRGHDGYRGNLNDRCITIAQALSRVGYGTYMTGKWHVTRHTAPDGPKHNWPLQRGFDRFYGTITGAGSFYDPATLVRGNKMITVENDPEYRPQDYYYTTAISDHASQFVSEHLAADDGRPFFLYVAYTAAHWPMHALEEDVARYRGKYDGGYTSVRRERYEQLKKLRLIQPEWELSPQAEDWNAVSNTQWETRCMEVYAAMIESMDRGIGQIVDTLEQQGALDNTLIFYLQDNGGCAEGVGRRKSKNVAQRPPTPTLPALGANFLQRAIIPKQTRDGFPVRQGTGVMPGAADTYIAYGRGWANVSNTPFREYKHWVHEGGISTPLIVHWPEGFEQKNKLVTQPGHLIDIFPTCLDVARADYPARHNDHPLTPLEGKSLLPAFENQPIDREAIYWEHEGNRAVRVGKWKLVAKGVKGKWELYDMEQDRTELHNLAEQHPDRVMEMSRLWQDWAERSQVLPLRPR